MRSLLAALLITASMSASAWNSHHAIDPLIMQPAYDSGTVVGESVTDRQRRLYNQHKYDPNSRYFDRFEAIKAETRYRMHIKPHVDMLYPDRSR